jgi:hypothetical protein
MASIFSNKTLNVGYKPLTHRIHTFNCLVSDLIRIRSVHEEINIISKQTNSVLASCIG